MFPKTINILIVDDMKSIRNQVKNSLNELGFTQVAEAENGALAFEKMKAMAAAGMPFQLIISDWNMPVMSGLELLKTARTTTPYKAVPFILITAETKQSQIEEAHQAGVSGYISKPFSTVEIKGMLKKIYALNQLQPERKAA